MLESKCREFQVEIRSPLDSFVLAEILGAAMDEDTSSRLEDDNVNIKDYDKVRFWIENRYTQQQSNIAGKTLPRVVSLHRSQVGDIILDPELEPGAYRPLTELEVSSIQ